MELTDLQKQIDDTNSTRLLEYLLAQVVPIELPSLAEELRQPEAAILKSLTGLASRGTNVSMTGAGIQIVREFQPTSGVLNLTDVGAGFKYGVTGDNHLASKYERMDVLNALFDMWNAEGVTTVFQAGNIIDGECRFNNYHLIVRGLDAQVDYLVDNWPQRDGMVTQFVTGDDHEGWYIQREGIDIGSYIQMKAQRAGRQDLIFVGHMEHNIELKAKHGSAQLRLMHAGGGSSYAISYTDQKYAESLQGGEKPTINLVGHYHKFNFGYPREMYAIQIGATQDQTPFMRKKKIQSMVGGVTLEFKQDERGLIRELAAHWKPFYDRKFYDGELWNYKW